MKTRRRARRLTLETLYEYDLANHDPIKVLQRRLEEQPLESTGISFATKLIKGVQEYQDRMDQLITRFAPEWPLEQMAVIDRNILRKDEMRQILVLEAEARREHYPALHRLAQPSQTLQRVQSMRFRIEE